MQIFKISGTKYINNLGTNIENGLEIMVNLGKFMQLHCA